MSTYERYDESVRHLQEGLPILGHTSEIREGILNYPSIIVVGETGSGKTTQIPQILLDFLPPHTKIAITEPRRLAATSVAEFVAEQRGTRLGVEVGYQVRFDDQTNRSTRANFYTDGIVVRKAQTDPLLSEFDVVMVDEAHERNLNADFLLGVLKNAQRARRGTGRELRVIVASATVEEEKFSDFFDNAPIIRVSGRQYPVTIHYEPEEDYIHAAAEKAKAIVQDDKRGNILIFMPGVGEIRKTIERLSRDDLDAEILPLHRQVTYEEQDRIFQPGDKRKIIVATNIAETSITVPGIRFVIDSGLVRRVEFDSQTGIQTLVTVPHAQSGVIQRAGRAGRTSEGECYRLYSREDFEGRPIFQKPEILSVDIGNLVLQMKKMGIDGIEGFDFIDRPQKEHLDNAIVTLKLLGALDQESHLTQIGSVMAEFPLEPHASRTVIEAVKLGCVDEVCTIMAFSGTRSVFRFPIGQDREARNSHRQFEDPNSDFITLLNIWREFNAHRFDVDDYWARDNFLSYATLLEVTDVRRQLLQILRGINIESHDEIPTEKVAKAIIAGHIDNLLIANRRRYKLLRDQDAKTDILLHRDSVLSRTHPKLVVAADIVETSDVYAKMCQAVNPDWIPEIVPYLLVNENKRQTKQRVVRETPRGIEVLSRIIEINKLPGLTFEF